MTPYYLIRHVRDMDKYVAGTIQEDEGEQPYVEIVCPDESWRHPIHIRLPPIAYAQARARAGMPVIPDPPPVKPKALGWELLGADV